MRKESLSAIFNYEKDDSNLIDQISEYLDTNMVRIYDFFCIEYDLQKTVINIVATKDMLDNIYKEVNNLDISTEVPKWLVGFSVSNMQIYYLSLNDYQNTSHVCSDYEKQLEMYKKTILHEFIHYVNRLFCKKNNCSFSTKFLAEGIAQYLSNQKEGLKLQFDYSLNDILNSNNCYNGWYLVTKYIIQKYPHEFFIELLKNNEKADKFLINQFDEINDYYLEQKEYKNL